MTLDEQITNKKSEAATAWRDYLEALRNAENNRSMLRGIREIFLNKNSSGSPADVSELALLKGLERVQAALDEKEFKA